MHPHPIQPVAHLRENPDGTWDKHDLNEHLIRVAESAASFADEFGNGDWVKAAGLLHDLKWTPLCRQKVAEFKLVT